jgi:hypothetical protein
LMAIGHRAGVLGSRLCEGVPQCLGEAHTMIGVGQRSAEIPERRQATPA